MRNHIILVLAISLLMYVVVGLNIPILRQIIGFIYLSFIPGFVLLKILKLEKLSAVDYMLLSVGLSIALLMFIGLLMNDLYPLFGCLKPLSTLPLILTLGVITLVMSIISYHTSNTSSSSLIMSTNFLPKALLLTCTPVLAVCGAWLENSHILLLMVVTIAIITMATTLSKRLVPTKLYSFVIIIIAASLLFHMSLISKYPTGWDIFPEYYIYKLTNFYSFWNAQIPFSSLQLSNYNAMLSITVLPTLFSSLLNIQGEWIFKIVYFLIFSFVPLTLYRTWEQQTGKLAAFLSTFYFMFSEKFYDTSEMRQIIAELFLALLFFSIANKKINGRKRRILLVIFGAALVVSHYSISYIFLFTIFFTWFFSPLLKEKAKVNPRTISGGLVLLFFVMAFSWYAYVSSSISIMDTFSRFINNTWNSFFIDFLNLKYRGETLYRFTNPLSAPSFLHIIDNILAKILYFFILIGFLGLFIRRMKYAQTRLDWEYALMITANVAILSAVILVPGFGPGFVTVRFFHVALFLLAPLCVLGGQTFFKWVQNLCFVVSRKSKPLPKNKALSLVCVVLVVIFLFKIGFVYEVTGDVPSSISLSMRRMEMSNNIEIRAFFFNVYVPEQDVFSAMWMSKMVGDELKIYADDISKMKVLVGYGLITEDRIYPLNSDLIIETDGCIYLRYQNVIDGTLIYVRYETESTESLNINEVSSLFSSRNKIYSNGFSEVYQNYKELNMTGHLKKI